MHGEHLHVHLALMMSLNGYCHVLVVVEQLAVRLGDFVASDLSGQPQVMWIVVEELDERLQIRRRRGVRTQIENQMLRR